ncbi:hypothetical protein QBC35DRAFT_481130 [Podospora australis]|uniref:Uncharacterized protein n=1 Tax=Podospora australis TaxID=1536484 RepID=A0AAN6X3Q7_9PEZI|nr:hypothetical protein QBC35DRAFT_481130 [Podospora australis]
MGTIKEPVQIGKRGRRESFPSILFFFSFSVFIILIVHNSPSDQLALPAGFFCHVFALVSLLRYGCMIQGFVTQSKHKKSDIFWREGIYDWKENRGLLFC